MSLLKKIARKIIFPSITSIGMESVFSAFSSNKNLIIMFHGVIPEPDYTLSPNHLSLSSFEKIIGYLVKNFQIVPLSQIKENKNTHQNTGKKQIAITFDDGYENNYKYAFPVLKKYKVPATIFTITAGIDKKDYMLWYDVIDILKDDIGYSDINSKLAKLKPGTLAANGIELKIVMKKLSTSYKRIILDTLIENHSQKLESTSPDYFRILNTNQIKEMIESGFIEIGSHTVNHPNLDEIEPENMMIEIQESKSKLEQITGKKVSSIAFPDGAYNEKVKTECMKSGYTNLVAVDYRLDEDEKDINIVPRFCISNTTTAESSIISINLAYKKTGF